MTDEKNCFVISPIGEPDSETRKRADQILKHVVKPAVGECGYTAVRADEIDKPGIITSQVIQRVVTDPLVVADLTERNPNVFYELAIRHALRKPLVQLIKKGEQIPFDVADPPSPAVSDGTAGEAGGSGSPAPAPSPTLPRGPGAPGPGPQPHRAGPAGCRAVGGGRRCERCVLRLSAAVGDPAGAGVFLRPQRMRGLWRSPENHRRPDRSGPIRRG